MITASRLAGFCAAHAAWSLSESDTFIPIFAYTDAENERKLERLVSENMCETMEWGRSKLLANPMGANDAVLLCIGMMTRDTEKIPAIIIEMRAYYAPGSEAVIAVPYTPKSSGKFLIHKPMLLAWKNCEDMDKEWALESFFEGVVEHKEAAKIWRKAWDPSK